MQPKRFHSSLLLILLSLFLSGTMGLFNGCCTHCFMQGPEPDELPPYFDGNIYYPITLGNQWIFSELGKEFPNTLQRTLFDTVSCNGVLFTWMSERERRYDGLNLSQVIELMQMATDTLYVAQYSYVDAGSLVVYERETDRLLNPLRQQDSIPWLPRGVMPNFGKYFWHIGSIDTAIVTTDTTWENCLETWLTFDSNIDSNRYILRETYFAPNVGPVLIHDLQYTVYPGDLGDSLRSWELRVWTVQQPEE